MKYSAATTLLAAVSAVSAAPHGSEKPSKPPPGKAYTLQAMRSTDNEIMGKYLQARDGSIKLGGQPKTYCPPSKQHCPRDQAEKDKKNVQTAFLVNKKSGRAQLDVEVPAGQILYVTEEGELSYTEGLHSSWIPDGSYQRGFKLFDDENFIEAPSQIIFDKAGATSWYACKDPNESEYTVYADVKGFTKKKGTECKDFMAKRDEYVPEDGYKWAAFQYS